MWNGVWPRTENRGQNKSGENLSSSGGLVSEDLESARTTDSPSMMSHRRRNHVYALAERVLRIAHVCQRQDREVDAVTSDNSSLVAGSLKSHP